MGKLKDKTIIITGGTSGIGAATARLCHAEGANVLIHSIDKEAGKNLGYELGNRIDHCEVDLLDPTAAQKIVDEAIHHFGGIDGIVNNAAMIVRSNLATTDADLFDQVMGVNVRAPMLLIQAARPYLKESKGSVVNIGSVNAYCGEPGLLAYSVSKGALLTLSRNLSDALATEGIRVNLLNPGWVLTENEYKRKIADGLPEDWPDQLDAYEIPSGKMTQPAEIAQHIVFWLSDESRPVSGVVMELNQYPFIGRNVSKEGNALF